jgi:hypothetical protein
VIDNRRLAVLAGLFFVAALVLQLPGHVPYDGIVVWHEAETGALYAQHPAALVLIWRLCTMVMRGPALFTAVSLACLWAAIAILLQRYRPPLWAAAGFCFLILVWPPLLAHAGVTVKDVFGAHLVLLAFVLASGERPAWFAAFALGTLAFLLRYQFGLILPVLAILAWPQRSRRTLLAGAGGILVTLVVVHGLVSVLFIKNGPGDVMLSLRKIAIFDIAGTVAHSSAPLTVFAEHGIDTARLAREMAAQYSPVRVDTLWQANESGTITASSGVFGRLYAVPDNTIFAQWSAIIAAQPTAFLDHRAAAFARVLGLGDIWQCRPVTAGLSWLPKEAAAAVHAKTYAAPLSSSLMTSRYFPVSLTFRAVLYLALALAVLIVGPRPAQLLSGFAILYELSFFLLPQACEVRYAYPVTLTAMVALAMTLERRFI